MRTLAPVLAVTAEEVWQSMRQAGWVSEASVHLARWPDAAQDGRLDGAAQERWKTFLSVREAAMKALEEQRAGGVIGSPLEARVTLLVSTPETQQFFEQHRGALAEALVVSDVTVERDEPACTAPNAKVAAVPGADRAVQAGLMDVRVERAPGAKCQRCWRHLMSVGRDAGHPQLCDRCVRAISVTARQPG